MNRTIELLAFCTFLFTALTSAQVPHKISYQGMLTTSTGVPVADASNYIVTISLYDALGNLKWGPVTHTGVTLSRGSFNVLLGSVGGPLPSDLFTQPPQPLYVEITASGPGISGSVTFSPRSELSSVPYSLAPWSTNGIDVYYNVVSGSSSGKVGIGTTTPSGVLDVVGSSSAPTETAASIFLRAGTTVTTQNGGTVQINGGAGGGAGNGGNVQIDAGSTAAGTAGSVLVSAGDAMTTGGGNLTFSAGGGRASGGNITFTTGAAFLGGAGSFTFTAANGGVAGGSFIFQAGTGSSTNGIYKFLGVPTGTGTALVLDANNNMVKLSSSLRYKNSISELQIDPDAVLKLKPVSFKWNTTGVADIGLIAEDVEKEVKDLVIYDNEGKPDGVKYDRLAIYLLELIKNQQGLIEEQKIELLNLAAKVKVLEATKLDAGPTGSSKGQNPSAQADEKKVVAN